MSTTKESRKVAVDRGSGFIILDTPHVGPHQPYSGRAGNFHQSHRSSSRPQMIRLLYEKTVPARASSPSAPPWKPRRGRETIVKWILASVGLQHHGFLFLSWVSGGPVFSPTPSRKAMRIAAPPYTNAMLPQSMAFQRVACQYTLDPRALTL